MTMQATTDANGAQGFNATATGSARTWTYTYNAAGQVLTARGPRTDADDTVTYSYDANGNLATVANALGHVTTLSNYDA
ncbi:RHS repeat protein, partial [Duganella sp. FT92W]|nr:RHS repeat protein [Pseudoduganella rivuli]